MQDQNQSHNNECVAIVLYSRRTEYCFRFMSLTILSVYYTLVIHKTKVHWIEWNGLQ